MCNELRERLEIDDVLTMLQRHRLRWYGHVSRNDVNDSVKKCISYEMEGVRPRGIKNLEQGCGKDVRLNNYRSRMLWTIVNGES